MGLWKTKDGRVLEISQMGTQHLSNAIAMLRFKGAVTLKEAEALEAEAKALHKKGDIAGVLALNDKVKGMKKSAALGEMEEELLKRTKLEQGERV